MAFPALLLLATVAAGFWAFFAPELRRVETKLAAARDQLAHLPPKPTLQSIEPAGFHSGIARSADTFRWVQVDLGCEYVLDDVFVVPAFYDGVAGYGFPRHFRIEVSTDPTFGESTTLLDHAQDDPHGSALPIRAPAAQVTARHVRFTATRLVEKPRLPGGFICCLGELLVFSGGRNVALRRLVTAPSKVETKPTWSLESLVDGRSALGLPVFPGKTSANGWHSDISASADSPKWVQLDLGTSRPLDEIRLIPARPPDFPDRLGFGFPGRFRVDVADDDAFSAPRLVFDATGADFRIPATMPWRCRSRESRPGSFVSRRHSSGRGLRISFSRSPRSRRFPEEKMSRSARRSPIAIG